MPELYSIEELEEALLSGTAHVVHEDPYSDLLLPEDLISAKGRERREKRFAIIEELVALGDVLFDPVIRYAYILEAAKKFNTSVPRVYRLLRRWWQGGQIRNAMLTDHNNCGNPGEFKPSGTAKRGRPREHSHSEGINVDETVRMQIIEGLELFHETPLKPTLGQALKFILGRYFADDWKWEDGEAVPILLPYSQLLTRDQVRYWRGVLRDPVRAKMLREGLAEYNNKYRPLLGRAGQMAWGPGSLTIIDSTLLNLYILSSFDEESILERLTLYYTIDVWTEAITGFALDLRKASWDTAMVALDYAIMDPAEKVERCAEDGVTVSAEDVPFYGIPGGVLADRGEFEGHMPTNMLNNMDTDIDNTAPYRGDLKGMGEVHFSLTDRDGLNQLPGYVTRQRRPGDADPRLKAGVLLKESTQYIIRRINRWNRTHRKDWRLLDPDVIRQKIDPTPINLWHWGVEHRSGPPRTLPRDIVRLNLLPHTWGMVTGQGIRFGSKGCLAKDSLYYGCKRGEREGWFSRARMYGNWPILLAYDMRTTNQVYAIIDGTLDPVPCTLLDSFRSFRDRDWYSMAHLAKERAFGEEAVLYGKLQEGVREQVHLLATAAKARARARRVSMGKSKAQRLRFLKVNTRRELSRIHRDTRWVLKDGASHQQASTVASINETTLPVDAPSPNHASETNADHYLNSPASNSNRGSRYISANNSLEYSKERRKKREEAEAALLAQNGNGGQDGCPAQDIQEVMP